MKAKLYLSLIFACAAASTPLSAQFYTLGSDPASPRWHTFTVNSYKMVYPAQMDSLARIYGATLQFYAGYTRNDLSPVGNTAGFRPNEMYRKRLPVVLHPYTAYSNGVVTWAPRRMDLFTTPEAYSPEPTPWIDQLAIHESRHVAQMQAGAAYPYRWLRILTGDAVAGIFPAVYGGQDFLEGDAVATETAITHGGRGRTADFLEFYRVSFADGSFRSYPQWRYGSNRRYTPDYYRAGYLMHAGIRTLYDVPDFTARYYTRVGSRFLTTGAFRKTVAEVSGGRKFKEVFTEICDTLAGEWAADEAARAPYLPSEQLTATPRRFTEFTSMCADTAGTLYAVRSGINLPHELVRIDSGGRVRRIASVSSYHSKLAASPDGRIWWSEYNGGPRWELQSWSNIRYIGTDGKAHSLTRRGRYYNPAPSPDGTRIAVSEYPAEGGTRLTILNAVDGSMLNSIRIPDTLQLLESVWLEDGLYFTALGSYGYGVYSAEDFSTVLRPSHKKITQLRPYGEFIMFTSDHNGVNELYSLDPIDGSVLQMTNFRFGAADFCLSGGTLWYSSLRKEGRVVASTPESALLERPVDFREQHSYPFADELSAQERAVTDSLIMENPEYAGTLGVTEFEVTPPENYSRLANLFRLHSWLPVFVDYDVVSSMSFSQLTSDAGLGATAYFQNELGNAYGSAGYHAGYDFNTFRWKHSAHFNFTYTGWFPVIEVDLDFNDRNAYSRYLWTDYNTNYRYSVFARDEPSARAELNVYVPLRSSRGSWVSGLIPQLRYSVGNDGFAGMDGQMHFLDRAVLSLRGYTMETVPESRIYPRWGLGAEAGYSFRPFLTGSFCSTAYAYLYAYVPGFWQSHGFMLTAMFESRDDSGMLNEAYLNIAPAGFSSGSTVFLSSYASRMKFTADYAMPIFPVEWCIGDFAYIRNFEFTPGVDVTAVQGTSNRFWLYSAGADFNLRLGSLLWLSGDWRLGVSYRYKGGDVLYERLRSGNYETSDHYIGLIFSVDF